MTIDIDMSTTTATLSPQAKGTRPERLHLSSLFTPPKQCQPKKHADIFSPRPETPSPPQFPFLDSPTPKRHNQLPSPPTPPRPRRRHALSDTTNAMPRRKVCGKSSFELALDAFPTPPARLPQPSFRSLPISHSIRTLPRRSSLAKEKEEEEMDSGSESDGRTITGIPATPSTANSGWDNFWSEPPSPAEDSARSKHEMLLTEAALIREAYLACPPYHLRIELISKKLKQSQYDEENERRYAMEVDDQERNHRMNVGKERSY